MVFSRSKIFISYSRKDNQWLDKLKTHLRPLERDSSYDIWEDTRIKAGSDWRDEINDALAATKVAIILVSPNFMASNFIAREEIPKFIDAAQQDGAIILPVIISSCPPYFDHPFLGRIQTINSPEKPLAKLGVAEQDDAFGKVYAAVKSAFLAASETPGPRTAVRPGRRSFTFNELPRPTVKQLAGRLDDLNKLKDALNDPDVKIAGLIAGGGVGKTALVYEWLMRLYDSRTSERIPERIYAWSFYESAPHADMSSAPFFEHFFRDLARGRVSASEQGSPMSAEKIAADAWKVLQDRPTLLVLDQLEPLQFQDDKVNTYKRGELADKAMKEFLLSVTRGLEDEWTDRLVLVTSREPLSDLEQRPGYEPIELENLMRQEGAQLLSNLHVNGSREQLERASVDLKGHALSLVLLGKLTVREFGGKIDTAYERCLNSGGEFRDLQLIDAHAKRIMDYYCKAWKQGSPERVLLQMMALFHRPMESSERNCLLQEAEFTTGVRGLSLSDWSRTHRKLEERGLLLPFPGADAARLKWDCHPLVREYVRDMFCRDDSQAWRQANNVLFAYYIKSAADRSTSILGQFLPLYRAVNHGCMADKYKEALDLYRTRIVQNEMAPVSTNILGATAQDLAALTWFRDAPKYALSSAEIAWVQGRSAFCYMCLGRLAEAIEQRKSELEYLEKSERWEDAISSGVSLSSLYVAVGDLAAAKERAEQVRKWAFQHTSDSSRRRDACAQLARVYHLFGRLREAAELFKQAEDYQKVADPQKHRLHAEPGLWFNLLLLDTACAVQEYQDINERADTAIDFDGRDEKTPWRLIVGLHHLVKARALSGKADWGAADWSLNEALKYLEDSGTVLHLADARLTRAEIRRQKICREGRGDPTAALEDVAEALVIADKCGMHLVRLDALLLKAKLLLDSVPKRGFRKKEAKVNEAKSCYNDVKDLLQHIGYGLREAEVLILDASLNYHQNFPEHAKKDLDEASSIIRNTGQLSLMREWDWTSDLQ